MRDLNTNWIDLEENNESLFYDKRDRDQQKY